MNLIQSSALWALGAVPLIVLLYILRPRHRRLVVPSVRLWKQLPSDLEGRPRWRLPVASLLLIAQVLIAAGLAFALARPALPGAIRQHLIVLLDLSPTMMATDVSPNRLGLAVSDAHQLAASLTPDDLATLITIEPSPRILATGRGPTALDDAIQKVTVAPDAGDAVSAMTLAAQTAQLSRDTHNRIVVISDGALPGLATAYNGPIAADVSFQQVGGSDENIGITALTVRPMIGSTNRYVGFVQVTNFSHQAATVPFSANADGIRFGQRTLDLPVRGHVELSLPLPAGTRHLWVGIDTNDKYRADDTAEVLVPSTQRIAVTLVTMDPDFWNRAFGTLSNVEAKVVSPTGYKPDNASVSVFTAFVPSTLPAGNIVLIAPPRGNTIVPVNGEVAHADIVHTDSSSTLFDAVDLGGLFVPSLDVFGTVPWAHSVADSSQGTAILDGTRDGRRILVLGFDPGTTDWPQRISFPVFVANLVDSLSVPSVPTDVPAGSVLDLPGSAVGGKVLVQLPNGKIDLFVGDGRPIRFTDTAQLGSYQVTYTNGSQPTAQNEFVVSRIGVTKSNILPQVDPAQFLKSGGPPGQPSEHDTWAWVAGGALALVSAEWLLYFRGTGR
jgi:Ca-activated chloride channel homolog